MVEGLRTEQEVVASLGDFGTNDPDTMRRTMNFIPKGFEHKLARLDELTRTLGYYTEDIAHYVFYLRENLVAVEGKARQDVLLGLDSGASAKVYQKAPSWQDMENQEHKKGR